MSIVLPGLGGHVVPRPQPRILSALVLSLGLHSVLVGGLYLIPFRLPSEQSVKQSDSTTPFCLGLSGPERRRAPKIAPLPEYDPEEFVPVLIASVAPQPSEQRSEDSPVNAGSVMLPGERHSGSPPTNISGVNSSRLANPLVPKGGPQRVIYLLDRSLSMGPSGGLQRARQEFAAALRELPDGVQVQVLAYNHSVQPLLPSASGYVQLDAANRDSLNRQLASLTAAGRTDHRNALRRGLALAPDVLYLLTDADDLSEADIRATTWDNRHRTIIHVVELIKPVRSRQDSPLARLAAANGGRVYHFEN